MDISAVSDPLNAKSFQSHAAPSCLVSSFEAGRTRQSSDVDPSTLQRSCWTPQYLTVQTPCIRPVLQSIRVLEWKSEGVHIVSPISMPTAKLMARHESGFVQLKANKHILKTQTSGKGFWRKWVRLIWVSVWRDYWHVVVFFLQHVYLNHTWGSALLGFIHSGFQSGGPSYSKLFHNFTRNINSPPEKLHTTETVSFKTSICVQQCFPKCGREHCRRYIETLIIYFQEIFPVIL